MKYRLLGKSGHLVSEALGTMTFRDEWGWNSFDTVS
jgi:hypothetical protein